MNNTYLWSLETSDAFNRWLEKHHPHLTASFEWCGGELISIEFSGDYTAAQIADLLDDFESTEVNTHVQSDCITLVVDSGFHALPEEIPTRLREEHLAQAGD